VRLRHLFATNGHTVLTQLNAAYSRDEEGTRNCDSTCRETSLDRTIG
jgi:hypothetical protein